MLMARWETGLDHAFMVHFDDLRCMCVIELCEYYAW